ncbi:hypothetical protein H2199_006504 [Coniosporium tulheliwenetii]|uniref:Uncharacterized protein n=1 Tax=Coniosporium tulheliwenetii TaxID=3383036 RepID=A0ACC2YW03_9PEZI|nr:hypothetical protein H2199_006504 [Cladosporium sp. JES 115]
MSSFASPARVPARLWGFVLLEDKLLVSPGVFVPRRDGQQVQTSRGAKPCKGLDDDRGYQADTLHPITYAESIEPPSATSGATKYTADSNYNPLPDYNYGHLNPSSRGDSETPSHSRQAPNDSIASTAKTSGGGPYVCKKPIHIPWASPASKQQAIQQVLGIVIQVLPDYPRQLDQLKLARKPVPPAAPVQSSHATSNTEHGGPSVSEAAPDAPESGASAVESRNGAAGSLRLAKASSVALQTVVAGDQRSRRDGDDHQDNDDDDRPWKLLILSLPDIDFSKGFPCIYASGNPGLYNTETHWKYRECQSSYPFISLLTRHLGRPNHGLINRKGYISQFEIEGNRGQHPGVALSSSTTAATGAAGALSTTPRGVSANPASASRHTNSGAAPRSLQVTPQALPHPDDSHRRTAEVALATPAPSVPADAGGAVVSLDEHLAVINENLALKRTNQDLIRENIDLRIRLQQQENRDSYSGIDDSAYGSRSLHPDSIHEPNGQDLEDFQSHDADVASRAADVAPPCDVTGDHQDAGGRTDIDDNTDYLAFIDGRIRGNEGFAGMMDAA